MDKFSVHISDRDEWMKYAVKHIVEVSCVTGNPVTENDVVRNILRRALLPYRQNAEEAMKAQSDG